MGRPGHELIYNQRVLHAWGIDGQNSHTTVCSAGARAGYAFWHGYDRPSPDHANARFILLLSSHLETGHYFNPHAQRIMEAKERGAKVCVIDTRLSNTASKADYWLSTWPGTEAAVLLAMANVILRQDSYDRDFLRRWVNWEEFLREELPDKQCDLDTYIATLKEVYSVYTRSLPSVSRAPRHAPSWKSHTKSRGRVRRWPLTCGAMRQPAISGGGR